MFKVKIHRVVGHSMHPTLMNNDYVICGIWPGFAARNGCLVVVSHPQLHTIVKRVENIDCSGRLRLSGDSDSSISSDDIGWVERKYIVGRVIFCISA
ncbi:S24 family peptidase [Paraglaciecola marina]|uniref:S24 family peptidase n=1 Tax=Paraglaciecola marina TaxID=2500157 RepID=UPI001061F334|nr:S24 family peptidase [Paraglaciecola marina]